MRIARVLVNSHRRARQEMEIWMNKIDSEASGAPLFEPKWKEQRLGLSYTDSGRVATISHGGNEVLEESELPPEYLPTQEKLGIRELRWLLKSKRKGKRTDYRVHQQPKYREQKHPGKKCDAHSANTVLSLMKPNAKRLYTCFDSFPRNYLS